MSRIHSVTAWEILDSRGHPTLRAEVVLESGARGQAAAPAGASTGRREAEDDWDGWDLPSQRLGSAVRLVGDDIFVTNPEIIRRGIEQQIANAVLIKPNQIGTLTETRQAIDTARAACWRTVISHRSGEPDDSSIADIATGLSLGHIKAGAPARGERLAKYNRLLEISRELGDRAGYAGQTHLRNARRADQSA